MYRSALIPLVAVFASTLACAPVESRSLQISDLSTASHTELIDRSAVLSNAVDPELASEGDSLDLRGAGEGYLLQAFDGGEVTSGADDLPRMYSNYLTGVAAVVAVDITTALVIATPAAAVGIAADGTVTQTGFNTWEATNTVDILGTPVTTHLTLAWVGVGWISEMRLTSDQVQDQLWFNGFVSNDGSVGWWDFYENGTVGAGVVEWATDGVDGEFGYGAITGENAGDVVLYTHLDGVGAVSVYDASEDSVAMVAVQPDLSGMVLLPEFNGGVEACWDEAYMDVECPSL